MRCIYCGGKGHIVSERIYEGAVAIDIEPCLQCKGMEPSCCAGAEPDWPEAQGFLKDDDTNYTFDSSTPTVTLPARDCTARK